MNFHALIALLCGLAVGGAAAFAAHGIRRALDRAEALGSRYEARVIADSLNVIGSRLTTMILTYPRYVHAEFMTHRMFARNASSSRAIPSAKMRKIIRSRMVIPPVWGSNKPGMQAGADVSDLHRRVGLFLWIALGHTALFVSACLDRLGVHKQIVNRVVEPWGHITVVVTGTDQAWANFYALRVHLMADPTIERIAAAALQEHRESTPRQLEPGEWHAPFTSEAERESLPPMTIVQISTARAARTSYLNHDGTTPDLLKDLALFARLVADNPKHASPTEHQAEAMAKQITGMGGCFGDTGWTQHRKTIDGEAVRDLSLFL